MSLSGGRGGWVEVGALGGLRRAQLLGHPVALTHFSTVAVSQQKLLGALGARCQVEFCPTCLSDQESHQLAAG